MKKTILFVIAALLLVSCVSFAPIIAQDAVPQEETSYIYGRFEIEKVGMLSIALQVINQESGEKFNIRFISEEQPVIAIAVPPGTYKIENVHYGWSNGETSSIKPFIYPDENLAGEFILSSGDVMYLGDYSGNANVFGSMVNWNINEISDNEVATRETFRSYYGQFAEAVFKTIFS